MILKNCLNCEYLEWIDGDVNDPSGFTCNKRLTGGETYEFEAKLLKKLKKDSYLNKSKVCYEPKSSNQLPNSGH